MLYQYFILFTLIPYATAVCFQGAPICRSQIWKRPKLRNDSIAKVEIQPNMFPLVRISPIWGKISVVYKKNLFFARHYTLDDLIKRITFYLYTERNKHKPEILQLNNEESFRNSSLELEYPIKMITHGYESNTFQDYMMDIKNNFLDLNQNLNVIAVDWSPIAKLFYPTAASLTDKIGLIASQFIDNLIKRGANLKQIHVIGHSLGAHVAGFTANFVKAGKLARVTGLDPAYPGFVTVNRSERLDSSDADFVDCIHTCSGLLAFEHPLCHADFYPNGGASPQPGCKGSSIGATVCSHTRANHLFAESILKDHVFNAFTCPQLPGKTPTECFDEGALMGYPALEKFQGIFYVETNSMYPYAFLNKSENEKST